MKGYYRLATAQLEQEEYDSAQATIKQGLALDANNSQLLKVLRNIKQAKKAASNKAAAALSNGTKSNGLSNGATPFTNGKLDLATSRELYDLQVQHAQTTKELNTVQANLTKAQREYKMQQLTHTQLKDQPEEKSYYRSIGKIFFKSTRDQVLDHLQQNMEERQKKEGDLKQKMDYLERRIKSQQQNMQELTSSANE